MTAIDLRLGRWQDALADVGEVDAVVLDAPYSDRTHSGHDSGHDFAARRGITYASWSVVDIEECVVSLAPRCRGWFVSITDDVLAPAWRDALRAQGRYVFAPLPYVAPGSRVRLAGDGPSSWSCWIVVARPRCEPYCHWGTLPGAYVLPRGHGERMAVVGGKPTWLMRALVSDYSRPGDLICDPCAGGGTTLLAAAIEGRRAIGAEMDPTTYEKARSRLSAGYTPSLFGEVSP